MAHKTATASTACAAKGGRGARKDERRSPATQVLCYPLLAPIPARPEARGGEEARVRAQSPRRRHWKSSQERGVLCPEISRTPYWARHFCRFRMGWEGYSYNLVANHKSTLPLEPRCRHLPRYSQMTGKACPPCLDACPSPCPAGLWEL